MARNYDDDYRSKQRYYSNASQKVQQINRDKKVQLRELSIAESKRDDLKEDFEKAGIVTHHKIKDVTIKGYLTISRQICECMDSYLQYHSLCATTLQKIQQDIADCREHISKREEKRVESTKLLNKEIAERFKPKERIVNHNPDLLTEEESLKYLSPLVPRTHRFFVRKEGSQKKYFINFFLLERYITIECDGLKENEQKIPVDDIIYLVKGKKNKENIVIQFVFRGKEDKPEKYIFPDHSSRELFYEFYWLAKRGLEKSFLSSSKRPLTHEELLIWCGTWNMGDAQPDYNNHEALENWMPKEKYDIYVVSTQESEYTPRPGYISSEEDLWSYLRTHLGDNYIKLANVSLQHIRLACFVRRNHYYKICKVKVGTVATGLAGVIGNKGGCGISFDIYDNRICFVGSHLAARIDRKRLEARNQNYRDILKGLSSFSNNSLSDIHHEFDHLIWLGDLNYRIEMKRDEIIAKIKMNDLESLRKCDQLLEEMKLENCFVDFEEMEINFSPTYRYNRGNRTFSEEKMREPAWCDRILYKPIKKQSITPLSYNACHLLMTSDHSPVNATFSINIDLPCIPHIRDTKCKINISNCKGFDLKPLKGNAGHYILFQAPFLSSTSTSVSEKSTNPYWNEKVVLYPAITNKSYLSQQFIRIVVKESKQDTIQGVGIIYLQHAIDKTIEFRTRIVDKARIYGYIEGTISVEFEEGYEDPYPFSVDQHVLKSTMTSVDENISSRPSFSITSKQSEHIQLDGIQDNDTPITNNSPKETNTRPKSVWASTKPRIINNLKEEENSNLVELPDSLIISNVTDSSKDFSGNMQKSSSNPNLTSRVISSHSNTVSLHKDSKNDEEDNLQEKKSFVKSGTSWRPASTCFNKTINFSQFEKEKSENQTSDNKELKKSKEKAFPLPPPKKEVTSLKKLKPSHKSVQLSSSLPSNQTTSQSEEPDSSESSPKVVFKKVKPSLAVTSKFQNENV